MRIQSTGILIMRTADHYTKYPAQLNQCGQEQKKQQCFHSILFFMEKIRNYCGRKHQFSFTFIFLYHNHQQLYECIENVNINTT